MNKEEIFEKCRTSYLEGSLQLEEIITAFSTYILPESIKHFIDGFEYMECGMFLLQLDKTNTTAKSHALTYLKESNRIYLQYINEDFDNSEKIKLILISLRYLAHLEETQQAGFSTIDNTIWKLISYLNPRAKRSFDIIETFKEAASIFSKYAPTCYLAIVSIKYAQLLALTNDILLDDIQEARDLVLLSDQLAETSEKDWTYLIFKEDFNMTVSLVFSMLIERFPENISGPNNENVSFLELLDRIQNDDGHSLKEIHERYAGQLSAAQIIERYYIEQKENKEINEDIYNDIIQKIDSIESQEEYLQFIMGYIMALEYELNTSKANGIGFNKEIYNLIFKALPAGHELRVRMNMIVVKLMIKDKNHEGFQLTAAKFLAETSLSQEGYYFGIFNILPYLFIHYKDSNASLSIFFGKYYLFINELRIRLLEESIDFIEGVELDELQPVYDALINLLVEKGRISEALEIRFFKESTMLPINRKLESSDFDLLKFVNSEERALQTILENCFFSLNDETLNEKTLKIDAVLKELETSNISYTKPSEIKKTYETPSNSTATYFQLPTILYKIENERLAINLYFEDKQLEFSIENTNANLQVLIFEWLHCIRRKESGLSWPHFKDFSFELYKLLFQDIHNVLKKHGFNTGQIIIKPDQYLKNLPFSALHDGENELIEYYQIHYEVKAYPYDSTNTSDDNQYKAALLGASYDSSLSITPLPNVLNELNFINEILNEKGISTTINNNIERSSKQVIELVKNQQDIMHIACHLEVDAANIYNSKLMLENDGGYILIRDFIELFKKQKPPFLIVFSACNAGLTSIEGNIHTSINQIFHEIGVKHVITTFWPLNDQIASELMKTFYKKLNKHLDNVPYALHYAQKEIRSKIDFEKTYFWSVLKLTTLQIKLP